MSETPDGWYPFGTHVDGTKVIFSMELGNDGLPFWERPVEGDGFYPAGYTPPLF